MRVVLGALILTSLVGEERSAPAGWRDRRGSAPRPPLVAPNGVITPAWAARRMENSHVPLFGYDGGRRPWAYPLAQQATASANMARWSQLGYGVGSIPGYTNGPPLGNYPTAPIGPTPSRDRGFGPGFAPGSGYPAVIYLGGN